MKAEVEHTMKTLLHIGCGQKRKDKTTRGFQAEDWQEIRFDIDPAVKPDVIGSMTAMTDIADASMDALFSSHNIEHLYPHEVALALAEFRRVLRPEGFAVITCPDLQSVAALVAEDKLLEVAYQSPAGPITPLDIMYGHRASMARGNLFMAHRTGFTAKTLAQALQQAGFSKMAMRKRPGPAFDLWAVASSDAISDTDLRQLAQAHFP